MEFILSPVHSVSLDPELLMSSSSSSLSPVAGSDAPIELSSDMSAIVKQLVFSPEKEPEQTQEEQQETQQVQENAAEEHAAQAIATVETVGEAEPIAASAEVEAVSATDDNSTIAPIAIVAAEPVVEIAEAVIAASSPLPDAVATAAPADAAAPADIADAEEEEGAAFPTFANAAEDEQMSYVSAEMKTQELLLLSARDQSASATPRSRRMSRSGASSGTATPRSSSSVRQAEASARLSAPSYSASKRRSSSVTPQSRQRDMESAVAAVALLRGSVKKPALQPEKRKLTLASSPKLTTRTRVHSSSTLSSEEAELLRMRVERNALKKLKASNAKNLESVLDGVAASDLLPVRSTKSLTQPQDVKLRTAGRSKTRTPVAEEADQAAEKKTHTFVAGQLTQSKPFAFQTDARSLRSASVSASRSTHASAAHSATPSRSASRSSSRAPSRSASRSVSRSSSRAGSRASSPSRSLAASSTATATAAPALTQPKEFSFATSKRCKAATVAPAEPTPVKKDRASMVSANGLTQPKPFALMTNLRAPLPAASAASGSAFVSLANQTANWLGAGHDRVVSAPVMGAAGAPQLTTPREFRFHTHDRQPAAPVLSTEERILAEAEAAKQALKAEKEAALKAATAIPAHRPLESFRAPSTLTQPQPFHLTTVTPRPREDKAALEAAAVEKEREERRRKVLAAARAADGTTLVQAPVLAVLQRAPLREPPAEPESPRRSAAATAAAHTGPTQLTIPTPFALSTDARGSCKADAWSAKLAAEAEAARAAAAFRAAPMPADSAPVFVPQVSHRKILADLPPNLMSAALHEQSAKQMAAKLAAESAADRRQRAFVAKPLPPAVVGPADFAPKPSTKALTAPEEPTLSSEQRAQRRLQLEREQAQRQAAAAARREEADAIRRREEAEELRRFRASLVVRANPVPLTSQAPR